MNDYVELVLILIQQQEGNHAKKKTYEINCVGHKETIYESRYEHKDAYMMNLRARYLITIEDNKIIKLLANMTDNDAIKQAKVIYYLDDSLTEKIEETYAVMKLVQKTLNTFIIEIGDKV